MPCGSITDRTQGIGTHGLPQRGIMEVKPAGHYGIALLIHRTKTEAQATDSYSSTISSSVLILHTALAYLHIGIEALVVEDTANSPVRVVRAG